MWPIITIIIIGLEINLLCMEPMTYPHCFRPAGLRETGVSVVWLVCSWKQSEQRWGWEGARPAAAVVRFRAMRSGAHPETFACYLGAWALAVSDLCVLEGLKRSLGPLT